MTYENNRQIRITRLIVAARGEMDVSANATEPALLVALTPARLEARGRKIKTARLNLEPGKTYWLGVNKQGQQQLLKNTGENDAE